MNTFSWFEFILFSLAVFRLSRLVVYDKIMESFRSPFMKEYKEVNEEGETEVFIVPREKGVRGWIGELLSCYWCTGIWASVGLLLLKENFPLFSHYLLYILAAAGLAALIETFIQSKIDN